MTVNGDATKVQSVEKNCPPIKFVGLFGVSYLGHKRPKMQKNLEWQTFRVDTALGQCDQGTGPHSNFQKVFQKIEML